MAGRINKRLEAGSGVRKRVGNRGWGRVPSNHCRIRAAGIGPDRINYARSDFPHPFQLRFSKEGMDHIVQNRPGSDLDGLVRVWPNAPGLGSKPVCMNHRALFLAGRNRPVTSFPLSYSVSVLPQTSRIILCKSSPDPI